MNADDILLEMKKLAQDNGVELTDNAINIARFRARTGLPMNLCPCDPKNPYRGCIGSLCKKELETDGVCHCRCFCKVDK